MSMLWGDNCLSIKLHCYHSMGELLLVHSRLNSWCELSYLLRSIPRPPILKVCLSASLSAACFVSALVYISQASEFHRPRVMMSGTVLPRYDFNVAIYILPEWPFTQPFRKLALSTATRVALHTSWYVSGRPLLSV